MANNITEQDRAWLAGFLDGEGTMFIPNRMGKSETLYITVNNTHKASVQEALRIAGCGSGPRPVEDARPQVRRQWRAEWAAKNAYHVLELVYPYLITKKQQASLLLLLRRTNQEAAREAGGPFGITRRVPQWLRDYRALIREAVRSLNKGLPAPAMGGAFKIPNEADAFHANQAEPDSVDFDILAQAFEKTGVVSGCAMTVAGTDMVVAVAAGKVSYLGAQVTVAGGNITIPAADATNPRFDLIMVDNAGALVTPAPGDGKGVAAAEPVFPVVPTSRVVLGAVYVPATDTAITSGQIIDKRVFVVTSADSAGIKKAADQAGPGTIFVDFDTSVFDNNGLVDLANDRLVIKTAGVYVITARAVYTFNAGVSGEVHFEIILNGATSIAYVVDAAGVAGTARGILTCTRKLAVNDNLKLRVFVGGAGNIKAVSDYSPFLEATKIADA